MLLRRSFCGFEGYSVKVCCPDPGATQPPAESEEPALVKPLSGPNRRPTARPTGRPAAAGGNVDFMLPASPQPTDAPYEFPAATDSRPAAAGGSGGNGGYVGSPSTSFAPSFGSGASAAAPSASSGSTPSASTTYPQPDPSMGEDLALSLGEPAPSPPDYPVENLALLPTEVCGLSMHREQHADRMVTNRTGIMRYPWMVRLAYKKEPIKFCARLGEAHG
ncbi:translation initiation factor IF-2-like [Frankliniella occidentalis]|uniref:Translation initiation factor IF-2-like n=1 Tax=Frankliniella occidentalis TaxID=133901 RepID=A0A9C6XTJ0_FRAOC|nr:translation initiation factor IF-2-like [Frankliniella occidentalis]